MWKPSIGVRQAFPSALALAVAAISIAGAVCGATAGTDADQHRLGVREQWQPKSVGGYDSDGRLDQPLRIEILGRGAVPALALLSEKTGVSLTVAPEDLGTVGERKLTVIAKGITLKAIMLNIPEALQECHWDVDSSGREPVYQLHRNSGMNDAADRDARARAEAGRPWRERVIAEVRRALAMSPRSWRNWRRRTS